MSNNSRTSHVPHLIQNDEEARYIWWNWEVGQIELTETGLMALRNHHVTVMRDLKELKEAQPVVVTAAFKEAAYNRVREFLAGRSAIGLNQVSPQFALELVSLVLQDVPTSEEGDNNVGKTV